LALLVTGFCQAQELQEEKLCRYGDTEVPEELFRHLIGWSCFEHVKPAEDLVTVHACIAPGGFKVPCIKVCELVIVQLNPDGIK